MVGDDDSFITGGLGSLDYLLHALVYRPDSFGNGVVNARMAHHIAIREVHNNKVVLIFLDSGHELILHLVSAHLRLQVVGCYLRRRHKDAVFALERSLTTTVEKESYVGILLCFGRMKLFLAQFRQVFAERILHVFFREEYVYVLEIGVVGRHAVVLQALNRVHSLFRKILLREYSSDFLSSVVTEIEEDYYVVFLDCSINLGIVDGLDELVRHALVVAFLHSLHHIGGLFALSFNEKIVRFFHTIPAFVAIHGVETTDNAGDVGVILIAASLYPLDETLTATRVGVASIHETVNKHLIFETIFLTDFNKLEQMIE